MEEHQALNAFGALSQQTRLRMVRTLVVAGPDGLAAGAVGAAVRASSSSASFHLSHLERAGLITSRREARSIIYCANYDGLAGLIAFLMEDCCQGRPEICAPAAQTAANCRVPTSAAS
ncbi:ArsR/SmtB family transcription factor [uncultured Devosia sp.]|uniref:ArsR/SmtB family transcription factor n=1 Tax=uncultured Devosia sp. TaxID=211434 RepID=UPI0035CAF1B2